MLTPGTRVGLFFAAMFGTFAVQGAYLPLWFSDRGLSAASIGLRMHSIRAHSCRGLR